MASSTSYQHHLEIVGLDHHTNGRSCTAHDCCGEHVEVGDVVRLVKTVVTYNDMPEEAVKCVKVVNGVDTCTVAFIPRSLMGLEKVQNHLNKFAQVVELYVTHTNSYKRAKSKQNYGMAAIELLMEDVGRQE